MPTAIRISGHQGNHALINDTYEPLNLTHNGKPCWVARSVASRYLYHTGKSRWVVGKHLDNGERNWGFVKATNDSDPSSCQGPWTCQDAKGAWVPDPNVKCEAVPASNDKFVQLRLTIDEELKKYGLVELKDLKSLWSRLDYNGNNIVSLAEIDKMVVELVAGKIWPAWLNNKPALMRAYKKTILKDGDGDSWVERKEFHALLLNIFWFNKLWQVYSVMDTGADRRLDLGEFQRGLSSLGLSLSQSEAAQEFQKIDTNGGGQVLFVEFCAYIRKRVNPDSHAEFDGDIISGEKCSSHMRKHHGHHATHEHVIKKKCLRDFDELEQKIKAIMQNHKKLLDLWHRIDFNGNNIVSLAEIDKLVVEAYPLLNHKPALMRAYKKTIHTGDGDDWVEKKEFKSLLGNLFYFNKIYWIFDQVDGDDRRLTFEEFKRCTTLCGCPMPEEQAHQEFKAIDRNGGGIILFDEFCRWFTMKSCPEAMTEFVR